MPERPVYCICRPVDGLLYVDVPNQQALLNLVAQQKWHGRANLRTLHGYTPHNGGGIAFKLHNLLYKGVWPSWYLYKKIRDDARPLIYDLAVIQLIEDGWFQDEDEAIRAHSIFNQECEWFGPPGMRFNADDIDHLYLGTVVGRGL